GPHGRRTRPPPQRPPLRAAHLPQVVRRHRPTTRPGRRSGAAVRRHVHRILHAGSRGRSRPSSRTRRLPRPRHRRTPVLRTHLDLHRATRRGAENIGTHSIRALPIGHAGRGGRAVLHRGTSIGRRRTPRFRTGPPRRRTHGDARRTSGRLATTLPRRTVGGRATTLPPPRGDGVGAGRGTAAPCRRAGETAR